MTSPNRTRPTLAAAACLALLLATTPAVAADSTDTAAEGSPDQDADDDPSRRVVIECFKDSPPSKKVLGLHADASMRQVGAGTDPETGATLFPYECVTSVG